MTMIVIVVYFFPSVPNIICCITITKTKNNHTKKIIGTPKSFTVSFSQSRSYIIVNYNFFCIILHHINSLFNFSIVIYYKNKEQTDGPDSHAYLQSE